MGQHIGIAAADDPAQRIVFTGDDQILQVDGPGKDAAAVHHIQRGDIVVLTGLPHQLAHAPQTVSVSGMQTKLPLMRLPISS